MTEENTTPDATTTPPAPDPASAPLLGSDGTPIDPVRQQDLIVKLRGVEKSLKQRNFALEAAVTSLAAGRPLSADAQVAVDAVAAANTTPAAGAEPLYEKTLRDVGRMLGLTDEAITAPGGPDALMSAAKSARIQGALSAALIEAGVADLALARSAINLANVDPTSANLPGDLKEVVGHFLIDHPSMKKAMMPAVSGAPFPAGSGGGQAPNYITQEAIQMASAEQVNAWRKSGLIPGFAGDRR